MWVEDKTHSQNTYLALFDDMVARRGWRGEKDGALLPRGPVRVCTQRGAEVWRDDAEKGSEMVVPLVVSLMLNRCFIGGPMCFMFEGQAKAPINHVAK